MEGVHEGFIQVFKFFDCASGGPRPRWLGVPRGEDPSDPKP